MKLCFAVVLSFIVISVGIQQNRVKNEQRISFLERQTNSTKSSFKPNSFASGNFRVYYYRCNWTVDPAIRFISGDVTSYFTITNSTNEIVYDLASPLITDSVIFHHSKITFTQPGNNTVVLNFGTTLTQNQSDSVTIFYHGIPNDNGIYKGSLTQAKHGDSIPVLWTLSEPYGASAWWPCRNGLDDKADSIDIYITHPLQYNASSNGILVDTTLNRNLTTTHYKERYPIASYLVAFAVTNYSIYSSQINVNNASIPFIQYIYPEDLSSFTSRTYLVDRAFVLFCNYFGLYPFSKERYGQTQFSFAGGEEHQTNSFVVSSGENLMVHELGHQWFGDKVTCKSWQDIWLNEGFATWLADLFYTEKIDTPYYIPYVKEDLSKIVSQPDGSVFCRDTTDVDRIFDSRLTYDKGAFLLRMLRFTLGDSIFFKGINQYLNDPRLSYGFATTADLQRNLEGVSGINLNYFFNQWFYGEGYPTFTLQWNQLSNGQIICKLNQLTSDPQSVNFFSISLPVRLIGQNTSKDVILSCTTNSQFFVLNAPGFTVQNIAVDPDMYFITKGDTSIHDLSLQTIDSSSVNQRKVTVYPNPVNTTAVLTLQNFTGNTNVYLYNITGVLIWKDIINIRQPFLQMQVPFNYFFNGRYTFVIVDADGKKYNVPVIK